MRRFSVLTEEICATEEGLQNFELFDYKEKNLVVIRKKWSLKEGVMDFFMLLHWQYTWNRGVRKNFN